MGLRRWRASTLGLVLLGLLSGCLTPGQVGRRGALREVTGSCEGACDHYLSCKGKRDGVAPRSAVDACLRECGDIYQDDPYSLAHFETLDCAEAVEFVEGPSGRGPGQTVASPN